MRAPTQIVSLRGIVIVLALLMVVAFAAQAQQLDLGQLPTEEASDQAEEPDEAQVQADRDCGCPSCEEDTDIDYSPYGFCKKWKTWWRRDLIHVNPSNCNCIYGAWYYTGKRECLEYRD